MRAPNAGPFCVRFISLTEKASGLIFLVSAPAASGNVAGEEGGKSEAQFLQNLAPERFSVWQFGHLTMSHLPKKAGLWMNITCIPEYQVGAAKLDLIAVVKDVLARG